MCMIVLYIYNQNWGWCSLEINQPSVSKQGLMQFRDVGSHVYDSFVYL